MVNGCMDTLSLIIVICVVIPALIAFIVCAVIFYSNQVKSRKFHQQRSRSYENRHSQERRSQSSHTINLPGAYRYQQQHRLDEPQSVLEQSPSLYENSSMNQTRRIQLPLFSPIRTTPSTTHVQRTLPVITRPVYETMPPSYDQIFLTPHPLTNQ